MNRALRPRHPRRGGILFGLLISSAVVVAVMIAGGFWVARDFSVKTVSRGDGDNVSIHTPVGDLNVRAHDGDVDPESLGVPVYPGARPKKRGDRGGGAAVEWTSRDGTDEKGISVQGIELVTPDSAGKVFAFYRTQLPNWIFKKEDGHALRLELREGGYRRLIAIDGDSDGATHIGIATFGAPPAN